MYLRPLHSFESLSCRLQIGYLMMNYCSSIAFVQIMEPLSNHHCAMFHTLLELLHFLHGKYIFVDIFVIRAVMAITRWLQKSLDSVRV